MGTIRRAGKLADMVDTASDVNKLPTKLKRLHPDSSLRKSSLDYWRKKDSNEIIESLKPNAGNKEPLTIKKDGTIMQGNTRTKILEERGIDIDSLPHDILAFSSK